MPSAYSPDAIRACYDAVKRAIPSAQLGGIYANKPGYHNCRNQLPSSDYSVQKPYDKKGDGWAAGALDITLQPGDMKTLTQRLITETRANGDKGDLRVVREFFGTLNGQQVTGMDVPGQYFVSSDDSHLWHVHLSAKREFANDTAGWAKVADVLLGRKAPAEGAADMPSQVYLTSAKATKVSGEAGKWVAVAWEHGAASDGLTAVLANATRFFDTTVDLSTSGIPPEGDLYIRIQTLDRVGKQLGVFPVYEHLGTSGGTSVSYSRVGSVSAKTGLRVLVAATHPCTITAGSWRTLQW